MQLVPQGRMFPALAVNLVNQQNSLKFDLFHPPMLEELSEEQLQYCNAI